MNDRKGFILVFDDSDISELLHFKEQQNEQAIDDFFTKELDQLIL